MRRLSSFLSVLTIAIFCLTASGQQTAPTPIIAVRAAHMLDVKSATVVSNPVVLIEGEKITEVGAGLKIPSGANVIDLGDATLLPGLIDCHTHMMLRLKETDDPSAYGIMLMTKSQAFRALEGAADARATLNAGFTSVRDVENEGSGYADVALRDAINQGLVEGPRMMVATRGIAAVGRYNPFGISPDLEQFPTGAQMISGVEDARRAAREQLGYGANLLKVYVDWRYPTLTVDEIKVVVEEAHKRHRKVAAHATSAEGIQNALTAGVDSIEHGDELNRALLQTMKDKDVFWVPTLSPFARLLPTEKNPDAIQYFKDTMKRQRQNLAIAHELGTKIANGSDADSPEAHGGNAFEVVQLHEYGLTAWAAIQAATVNASELMGWQDKVGSLEKGKFADVIAVSGDPVADIKELQNMKFVMKGGTVVKNDFAANGKSN